MFLYSKWLSLPLQTRHAIARQFNIVKRGSTEVFNNEVKHDGYVISEVEGTLNIDALQKYLSVDETDMAKLFEWMVAKIEGKDIMGLVSEPVTFNARTIEPVVKVFCQFCTSKGVRHLKICTRPQ